MTVGRSPPEIKSVSSQRPRGGWHRRWAWGCFQVLRGIPSSTPNPPVAALPAERGLFNGIPCSVKQTADHPACTAQGTGWGQKMNLPLRNRHWSTDWLSKIRINHWPWQADVRILSISQWIVLDIVKKPEVVSGGSLTPGATVWHWLIRQIELISLITNEKDKKKGREIGWNQAFHEIIYIAGNPLRSLMESRVWATYTENNLEILLYLSCWYIVS